MLGALPRRWLSTVANVVAVLLWSLRPGLRERARQGLALTLGASHPAEAVRSLLRESLRLSTLDRLASLDPRGAVGRRAATELERVLASCSRSRDLFLSARAGWPKLLARLSADLRLHLAWMEDAPARAEDAATLAWWGRLTLFDLAPLRRAGSRGGSVRLLLLLPDEEGRPRAWASPALKTSADGHDASGMAQQALDALATLVTSAPEVLDWTAPRFTLRPEIAREGHAPWSRLAPWLAAPRRSRQRRGP